MAGRPASQCTPQAPLTSAVLHDAHQFGRQRQVRREEESHVARAGGVKYFPDARHRQDPRQSG